MDRYTYFEGYPSAADKFIVVVAIGGGDRDLLGQLNQTPHTLDALHFAHLLRDRLRRVKVPVQL